MSEQRSLPAPATTTEIILCAIVEELRLLNAQLATMVAVQTAPPQPSPNEGGSSDGADSDDSVVVPLREPVEMAKPRKRAHRDEQL